jgi:ABC-type uncharacterized transport system permease subunit
VPDIVVHLVAAAAYLGLAWHFWNTRWESPASTAQALQSVPTELQAWERAAILVPLALHGWLLYQGIFSREELRFGFAQALSAMLWLAVAIYWVESLFFRLEGMQPLVLGAAAVCVVLPAWFSGRVIAHGTSMDFRIHLSLAIVAYSLFTIAILHAALMAAADRLLHGKQKAAEGRHGSTFLAGPIANLPPLLTIEKMFFRLVAVAFAFLTVTLITGVTLTLSMFGKPMRFNHETVFAVLSWIAFAVLLWGRLFRGWRGRTALRWTIAGFVFVVLANIGTAFVLEVVLQRG